LLFSSVAATVISVLLAFVFLLRFLCSFGLGFLDREKFILLILAWDRVYWLVGSGGKSVGAWGGVLLLKQENVRILVVS
jgi:hypothetical protein